MNSPGIGKSFQDGLGSVISGARPCKGQGVLSHPLQLLTILEQARNRGSKMLGSPCPTSDAPAFDQIATAALGTRKRIEGNDGQTGIDRLDHGTAPGLADEQISRDHPLMHILNPSEYT